MTSKLANAVFLVSGGGRGITAHCLIQLAARFPCQFIILGRTLLTEEVKDLQHCSTENELKTQVIADFQARNEKITLSEIQKIVNEVLAVREVKQTLQTLTLLGAKVEYFSVDVTDSLGLQKKLQSSKLGKITGIIHGAGVLNDKLIEKKTEQDFDFVCDTKVLGLQNLLDNVDVNSLDYLLLFCSVVGFYGNKGQIDYAIANEILTKFAHQFKHQHPDCHVTAFNWGPWEGGMVTPQLKQLLSQNGVDVISLAEGSRIFVETLSTANKTVQLLVCGALPFPSTAIKSELGSYRIHRKLTLDSNPFLHDHRINGKPVLPTTCAITWMANTSQEFYPGYQFHRSENLKVLKGIVFDKTLAKEYCLDIEELSKSDDTIELAVVIWSQTDKGKLRYHYKAHITLLKKLPRPPVYESFDNSTDTALVNWQPYAILFHGSCFQIIQKILNISQTKLTVECCFTDIPRDQQGQFPVLNLSAICSDVLFQGMGSWVLYFYQAAGLPLSCQLFEVYLPIPAHKTFYLSMEVETISERKLIATVYIHDVQGNIYIRAVGAELIISKQMNHLFTPVSVAKEAN